MAAVILLLGIFLAATGNSLVQRWQSSRRASSPCPSRTSSGSWPIRPGLIVITWWVMSLADRRRGGPAGAPRQDPGRRSCGPVQPRRSCAGWCWPPSGCQLLTAPLATAATPPAGPGPARPRGRGFRGMDPDAGAPSADCPCPRTGRRQRQPRPRCPDPAAHRRRIRRRIRNGSRSAPSWMPARWLAASCAPRTPAAAPGRSPSGAGDSLWSIAAAAAGSRWRPTSTSPASGRGCIGQPGRHRSRPAFPASRPGPDPPAAALRPPAARRTGCHRPTDGPGQPSAVHHDSSHPHSHQPPAPATAKEPP